MTDNDWDLFISYRRRDAAVLARWVARRLRRYRLPPDVLAELPADARAQYERRPRIFLDTDFERASPDFLEHKVYPALDAARRLLVISTPAAFETVRDRDGKEQPNWLCLEVDRFLNGSPVTDGRPIDVALGPNAPEDTFPGRLNENTRWDWIDLRSFTPLRALGLTGQLDVAVVKLVATLYDVDHRLQAALRQEEQKRRNRFLLAIGSVASIVALIMAGLTAYALDRQVEANRSTAAALDYLADANRRAADALATTAGRAQLDGDPLAAIRLLTDARASAFTPRVTAQSLITPAPPITFVRTLLPAAPEGAYVLAFRPGTHELIAGDYRGRISRLVTDVGAGASIAATAEVLLPEGPPVIGLAFASANRVYVLRRNTPDAAWNAAWPSQAQVSDIQQFDIDAAGRFSLAATRAPIDATQWLSMAVVPGSDALLIGTDRDVRVQAEPQSAGTPLPDEEPGGLPGVRVAVSSTGELAAASTIDGRIRVWSLRERRLLARFRAPKGDGAFEYNPFPLAFSPNGRSLAFGSFDGTVHIWRLTDEPTPGRRFRIHAAAVAAMAWSAAGNLVAAGAHDGQTAVIDPLTGVTVARLATSYPGLLAGSMHAAFSDDGSLLATTESVPVGSGDKPGSWFFGNARLWSVHPRSSSDSRLLGAAFADDGRLIAWRWEGSLRLSLEGVAQDVQGVSGTPWTSFSRALGRRAYVSHLKADRSEYSDALGTQAARPGEPGAAVIGPSALSPDGRQLALLAGRVAAAGDAIEALRLQLVDTQRAVVVSDVAIPGPPVGSWGPVVFASSGTEVFVALTRSGPRDTRIVRVNPSSGALDDLYTWPQHDLVDLVLSPDRRWLAMSDTMGNAQLFDLSSSACVEVPPWTAGVSLKLAFDPSARRLVVAGLGQLRVFDLAGGTLTNERRATVPGRFQPTAIDVVPHDSLLAIGNVKGGVGFWSLDDLAELVRLPPSGAAVIKVDVSPDGERVLRVDLVGLTVTGGTVPPSVDDVERITRLTVSGGEARPITAERERELRGTPRLQPPTGDPAAAEFWRLVVAHPLGAPKPTSWWGWLFWRPGTVASPELEAWRLKHPNHPLIALL